MAASRSTRRPPLPTSPFHRPEVVPPSTAGFSVGDRVTADRLGMGKVIAVDDNFVTVDFGSSGIPRVPAGASGFSRLE